MRNAGKIAILMGSLAAGILGSLLIKFVAGVSSGKKSLS
jgi:hypothetical protein